MTQANRTRLLASPAQWFGIAVCVALGVCLFSFVDLRPKVQTDFFFASGDPQLQSLQRIEREFGSDDQLFIAASTRQIASKAYLRAIYDVSEELRRLPGVADVRSVTHGPDRPEKVLRRDPADALAKLAERPFWSRLLLAPDHSATFIVLRLGTHSTDATIAAVDRVIQQRSQQDFQLGATGVSYVASHIRQRISDDLYRFSTIAFVAFSVLVTLLFRSSAILLGTMVASLTASFGTFIVRSLFGMDADILMPNLWTIAFVLTLSHIVYLTAEWQRNARQLGSERATRESIRTMRPACTWSLVANLLGFASLMFVSATPLRQFGISGAIAAILAAVCAFALYPPFLRAARPPNRTPDRLTSLMERFFTRRHPIIAGTVLVAACVLAPYAWRVNTDPSLPSYFAAGDPMSTGLRSIDRVSGSSTLDIVVADPQGQALDNDAGFDRLEALQHRLERHPDVGAVLSIALLMAETKRPWYSFLFSWERKLDRLASPKYDRVGRTFIDENRKNGRYILRMHELARSRPREKVIGEIKGIVRAAGLTPSLVGGLYPLQGQLSELVQGSVIRGLGGLVAVFFVIVLIVSRSLRTAVAMAVCLAITPLSLFGLVGLLGMPLDIIAAPAANVALPMGIDEMIHMGHTLRKERALAARDAWQRALKRLWGPILASMLIVISGFMLFLLSSFPPTSRLGMLVCLGALTTNLVVLLVLPTIAVTRPSDSPSKHPACTA